MKRVFACFSDGMGLLLARICSAMPSVTEVIKLLKNGRLSAREGILSTKDKFKSLLATNIDLGLYHFYRGNISDAKTRFWLISIVRPKLPDVYYNIGRCHFVLRNFDKAAKNFNKALSFDKNNEESKYYLNKMAAPDAILEVPENVIKQHFNYTSEYFVEHWLVAKNYHGHEYVRSLVMNFFGDRSTELHILDLGCGTGICGQFLKMKGVSAHITGVDISRRMLNIARQCLVNGKQTYNELVCLSIRDFLQTNTKRYDVIILTEVLHYYGDLTKMLSSVSATLSDGGMIFGLVREGGSKGYKFVKEGDFFCHSSNYVVKKVEEMGLHLHYMNRCNIYGDKVSGLLFAISNSHAKQD
ncbi:class I SAM-dependent DNA methyltransferase [Anaplasma bovis]|uniref:class I SAM-dependent DNA methyltransferase n=1 Tax=Anaplasma bovis TaxID=186733 RepID=UPI002FF2B321